MTILLGVIALFALVTLLLAVQQGRAIVLAAPKSAELGPFMVLGWWKFRQLKIKAGPAAAPQLMIYQRAVIAFLVFVILGVILSGWTAGRPQANATVSLLETVAVPSQFASIVEMPARRVAEMPGAQLLES